MEASEREVIFKAMNNNAALKRLVNEHERYEIKLKRFANRNFLTAKEELEMKRLKKEKLVGKEKILQIVYRSK